MPKQQEPKKRTRNVAEGLTLDVDVVIEKYNEANPNLKPLTKIELANKLGVHPMVFATWKKQAPYILKCLLDLLEIADVTIYDIVKKQ